MKGGNTRYPISRKKSRSNTRDEDDPKEGGATPRKRGVRSRKKTKNGSQIGSFYFLDRLCHS
jgi:hypothetical protein